MSRVINHSDGAHWYDKIGRPQHDATLREARKQLLYPSVTSIDKDTFPNLFLERWKNDQLALAAYNNPSQPNEDRKQYANRIWELAMEKATEAAIFGKKLHDATEKWPAAPSAELLPWFIKFDNWMQVNGMVPIKREARLLHHGLGVAGTTDFIGTSRGRRVIADWKTQDVKVDDRGKKKPAFYDSWVRQLALYEQSDRIENSLTDPSLCVSLIIDSNEGGDVYEKWWTHEEIQAAWEEFVAGTWLWCRKRGYWPVGEWRMERV